MQITQNDQTDLGDQTDRTDQTNIPTGQTGWCENCQTCKIATFDQSHTIIIARDAGASENGVSKTMGEKGGGVKTV